MAVQQVLRKCGQWSVTLRPEAPTGVVGALEPFGHVVIVPGMLNPAERATELLAAARYVGVLRDIQASSGTVTLSGLGLESWLGDDDGQGPCLEHPAGSVTGVSFADAIRAVLPTSGAIIEGTLYPGVPGTYTGNHAYQTARTAVDYICDTMSAEWRVTSTGRLDAGPASALFNLSPTCVIVRNDPGRDVALKAIPGGVDSTRSVKGYTTRVVLVAAALAGGTADAATVPFKDLHGNPVRIVRVIDEQDDTLIANAATRAQAALAATNVISTTTRLSADDFDVAGDFQPGDAVWVYDPAAGVFDDTNEVQFRGQAIYPVAVRVMSVTWPVQEGYTVAYRTGNGEWVDLTPWVQWEPSTGGAVEVSDRLMSPLTSRFGSIGTQVAGGGGGAGDTAVPGVPVLGAFTTTSYQPDDGLSRAAVKLTWTQPTNTDGSTIVDGDRYEIRYRPSGTADWQITAVPFDHLSATVTNLPPSTGFDWQIRAVDYATPTNYGAWSSTTAYTTADDVTAPPTPAPASVAASLIAVQVTHQLGLAAGGTFNLPLDMDHLEVHMGATAGFTPDASSLAGKLQATGAMVSGGVAAVGTFPTSSTAAVFVKVVAVDKTGNRSTASSAASATATLIDNAHITDLTVSKITAGTLSVAVTLSGSIKTGTSGARTEMDINGIRLYNSAGVNTFDANTSTGNVALTGTLTTATSGNRIEVTSTGGVGTMYFRPATGTDYAYLNSPSSGQLAINSGNAGSGFYTRVFALPTLVEMAYLTTGQVTAGGRFYADAAGAHITGESGDAISAVVASGASMILDTTANLDSSAGSYVHLTGNAIMHGSGGAQFHAYNSTAYMESPSGGGGCVVGVQSGGSYVWAQDSTLDIQGNSQLNLYGDTVYLGASSGDVVRSDAIYNTTATFTANVGIATTPIGRLYRLTSSARYKVDIAPVGLDPDGLYDLQPITYFDRGQAEEAGSTVGLSQHVGLIAEQVAAIPGWGPLLAELDEDGDPESVNYERVGVAALVWLRDLEDRVRAMEKVPALPKRKAIPKAITGLSTKPRKRRPQPSRDGQRPAAVTPQ